MVPDRSVRLRLITLDRLDFCPGEVVKLARHRFMLAYFLALAVVLILINPNGTARELSLELRGPVYLIGTALSILFLVGCLRLAEWRARRGRGVVLHASPLLLGAAFVGLYVGETLSLATTQTDPLGFVEGLLLVLFYYVMAEIMLAVAMGTLIPRALREIRGQAGPPRRAAPPVPAPAPSAPANLPDIPMNGPKAAAVTPLPRRMTDTIRLGNSRFLVADLHMIEAEGNYVRIVTPRARTLVPGPFSTVLAALPDAAGHVISRSRWVATSAVIAHRRAGRDLYVLMADGKEMRVAASRRDQVLARLRAAGAAGSGQAAG